MLGGKGVTIFVVPKQAHIDMDNLVDCNYHNLAVPRHILTFDLDRIGMPLESAWGLSVHLHQCMAYTGQGTANTWDKVKGLAEQPSNRGGKNNRKPIMKGGWLGRGQVDQTRGIYGCPPDEGKCAKHP